MEHLHGPPGAECVTIALEQIESVRSVARTRRIRRLTSIPAPEEICDGVKIKSCPLDYTMWVNVPQSFHQPSEHVSIVLFL